MDFEFEGELWYWRGPSPFHFITLPDDEAEAIHSLANEVTCGWGMIPVRARIGKTTWRTSMFAKVGGYVLPIKNSTRKPEALLLGDRVKVQLTVLAATN
ncbi:MAG: DUF1905 domain-containing protein [Geodermatophilaceae bacterium]|nr:DUF1905 domain-containing protein [Geodermatophilaceae bacterium]